MATFGSSSAGELVGLCGWVGPQPVEQGRSLGLGTTAWPRGEVLDPFSHKASVPLSHLCIDTDVHTRTGLFCRVWFDASSTGFTGSEIHFAMNRQEVVLPFEEDVWEKETLPSPGPRGAYLSDPQRAPLMPPPPAHHLCTALPGLGCLSSLVGGGFTVLHTCLPDPLFGHHCFFMSFIYIN